ncbi:amino acid adenylation [Candidatus Rickettsiella viridis]|uniref:Amino acid adenylation n=1 Tax=Candidatus Rickettsiella viridis TaxID=676208 RepID=A0A2Z5UU17_9COXI|nr:amino acid adenylation domain-containing protein [Candidatus Rickettsiella viridis]BBB15136.1 amino acid adenylation [Candidatus Rickettsiella viridis]
MQQNKKNNTCLMQLGQGSSFPYKQNTSVNELLETHVKTTPHAVAVRFNHQFLSYYQLNCKVNQLANYLIKKGLSKGQKVAIHFMPSLEMIISILAILKTGNCYIPLDINYPINRLNFMLKDCSVAYLLTQSALVANFKNTPVKHIIIDESMEEINTQANHFISINDPNELAYIIYTSGSTGVPNGVKIHHRAINNHMSWMQHKFQLTSKDKILLKTPLSFDPSVWEIFLPFYVGCELIIAPFGSNIDPNLLVKTLIQNKVTTLQVVPSFLKELLKLEQFASCHSLRHVFCGGESLPTTTKKLFFERLHCPLHNLYGPTEATIDITSYTVTDTEFDLTTNIIGKPIYNTSLYVINTDNDLVDVGEEGELYIASDSLSLGYHNRDQLTQERFIDNPFEPIKYPKMYKTGDIVRWLAQGDLEYLGRNNEQLKINGVRIEPNELISVILKQPSISEAIVTKKTDTHGYDNLICYLVPKENQKLDITPIKLALQNIFPHYMLPKAYIKITEIPLTLNGKVDTSSLPEPDFNSDLNVINVAISTKEEKQLLILWQETLGTALVNLEDNFFECGGSSLLALKLLSKIKEQLGVELSIKDIFTYPSLKQQAHLIQSLCNKNPKTKPSSSSLITLQPQGNQPPLFLIHPIGGTIFWYYSLAKLLKKDRPIYAFQDPSIELEKPVFESIEEIASFYLEQIKQIQPNGKYLIGGASFGTTIAVEIAHILHQAGEEVTAIVSLDGWGVYPTTLNDVQYFKKSMERQHQMLETELKKLQLTQPKKLLSIQSQRLGLLWKYQVKRITCPMALFKSSEILPIFRPMDAPMNHWENFCDNKINSYLVPGNHETMFQKPHVETLANLMDGYFDAMK